MGSDLSAEGSLPSPLLQSACHFGRDVKIVGIDLLLLTSSRKVLSKILSLNHHLATTPATSVTSGSHPLVSPSS